MNKACIVIPIYNESANIGRLVTSLKKLYSEIIVIDDGSTDLGAQIAKERGAVVISETERHGKGYSLRVGFQYALHKGFDGVVTMDGDGQHAVDDVDRFIQKALNRDEFIIIGNRMYDAKKMPIVRRLTNKFMSKLISLTCKQKIPDSQCGFRYISRKVLERLDLNCNEYEIETEMIFKAAREGMFIESVPIKTIYADEKSHVRPIKDTIRFFAFYFKSIFFKKKRKK